MNCSGGRDAVGLAGSRARRPSTAPTSAGLHRGVQRAAREAAWLHLRGARSTASPIVSRSRTPAGSRTSRSPSTQGRRPVPDRGQLRLPVRLLSLRAAGGPDGPVGSTTAASCRCSRSWAVQRRPGAATAERRHVQGRVGAIDEPGFDFGRPRRACRATTNDEAISFMSAPGLAHRARRSSPGSKDPSTTTAGSTSPRPRAAGHGTAAEPTTSAASGNGTGQIWASDTRSDLHCSSSRRAPTRLDFPDNVTTSPRGTLILCEDHIKDNFLRGLCRDGKLFDIAHNRSSSQLRRPQPTGSTTSSPARRSAPTAGPSSSTSRRARASRSRSGDPGGASASEWAGAGVPAPPPRATVGP